MSGSVKTRQKTLALLNFNGERKDNRAVPAITKLALQIGFNAVDVFDVRAKELPNIQDYDVFVGTGGPGDPNDWGQKGGNDWGAGVFKFMDDFDAHNRDVDLLGKPGEAKDAFYICHSFQMLCIHNTLGELKPREQGTLLGVHKQFTTPYAKVAPHAYFSEAPDVLYTFESRDWNVKPVYCTDGKGKFIPVTMDENDALTGVCSWDGHIIGVQFHPEATVEETRKIICDTTEERNVKAQQGIITLHGEDELEAMRAHVGELVTPNKIFESFLSEALHKRRLKVAI